MLFYKTSVGGKETEASGRWFLSSLKVHVRFPKLKHLDFPSPSAGNNWGLCPDGSEAVGCGPTETFVNCADVSVVTTVGGLPPLFISAQDFPYLLYYRDFRSPTTVSPLVLRYVRRVVLSGSASMSWVFTVVQLFSRAQVCEPTTPYRVLPGMSEWCQTNCLRYPPNCPPDLCQCP